MPDTREASHVFRVDRHGCGSEFIDADEMVISPNEAILLYVADDHGSPATLVAKITDEEGVCVTRVANLLTPREVA